MAVATGSGQDTACENGVQARKAESLCFDASEGSEGSGESSDESGETHFLTGLSTL